LHEHGRDQVIVKSKIATDGAGRRSRSPKQRRQGGTPSPPLHRRPTDIARVPSPPPNDPPPIADAVPAFSYAVDAEIYWRCRHPTGRR
jgi:hypothetical protein